jgi:hypothetical protein
LGKFSPFGQFFALSVLVHRLPKYFGAIIKSWVSEQGCQILLGTVTR